MSLETNLVRRRILLGAIAFGVATPASATFGPGPAGMPDEAFVAGAITTGGLALQTSLIARAKSPNPDVRAFAQSEINEQTFVAETLGAAPAFGRRERALIARHRALPGGLGFDRFYVANQIVGHQELLALNSAYARSGADPELRGLSRQTLPLIRTHLAALGDLRGALVG